MAGPVLGTIEHFINGGSTSGSIQGAFVELYKFFNDNTGTMGFQRIAYHTGANGTGMTPIRGMNRFYEPNPAGENAWACFRSTLALQVWYVLFQWSGASNFGTAPGSPGLVDGSSTTPTVIGFSFAQRADGGNPWNGTTNNDGTDTKGTPVWTPGVSSLALYPRSNDTGGSHVTSKNNCIGVPITSNQTIRFHILGDYDNFCFLEDTSANNTYDNAVIFGQYVPWSGSNPTIPYFAFAGAGSLMPVPTSVTFGGITGISPGGGISHPNLAVSGTKTLSLDRFNATYFQSTTYNPSAAFPTASYYEMPLTFLANEAPYSLGHLGQHNLFFREVFNVSIHDTNADGTRAVFGSTAAAANVKLTVPWNSGTTPGTGTTITGSRFSIP